jgi:hypothetical protein
MTATAARQTKNTGSRFRAIGWVVLFAFTLQSFITQTHIHGVFSGGNTEAAKVRASGSPHGKAPKQNSSAGCPFCQAITHAGVFAAPSSPNLVLPIRLAELGTPLFLAAAIGIAPSLPWHSRAPPHV